MEPTSKDSRRPIVAAVAIMAELLDAT